MAITNFVITTNGAGYAESDGLNPIASTEATAVIKNGIVSIVLSDGSSWKSTPLENCTLGGNPLDSNPRIAIDQLALAGFKPASGGSGADTNAFVDFGTSNKANGTTQHIERSGQISLFNNGSVTPVISVGQTDDKNNPNSNFYSLDVDGLIGQGGNVYQQEVIYYVDKPYGNIFPHLGSTVLAIAPSTANTDTAAYSLVVTQPNGASPVNRPLFNISNGFNNSNEEVFKIINTGQLKLNKYTSSSFFGIGNKLAINNGNVVQMNTFSQSQWVSNSITTTQVINGNNLNLLDLISDSDKSNNGTIQDSNELSITSDVTGNYIQFNDSQRREKVEIRVQYGVDHGGTDFFRTSIRRKSDDSLVFEQPFGSNGGDNIRGSAQIISYIFDSSDPFINGGIYISFDNDSGGNADIGFFNGVGLNILIFRTLI